MTQSESVSVKAEHKQASIRDTVSCSEILWIQSKSKAESPHWHTNKLPITGPAEVSAEWITLQRFPTLFGECCHSNTKLKAALLTSCDVGDRTEQRESLMRPFQMGIILKSTHKRETMIPWYFICSTYYMFGFLAEFRLVSAEPLLTCL